MNKIKITKECMKRKMYDMLYVYMKFLFHESERILKLKYGSNYTNGII